MHYFEQFTAPNIHQRVDWVVNTNCNYNKIVLGDNIIRKIQYKPLLVDLGLHDTAIEYDVIRVNYFCYTYVELYYILKFGYTSAEINKDKNYISSDYFRTTYNSSDG